VTSLQHSEKAIDLLRFKRYSFNLRVKLRIKKHHAISILFPWLSALKSRIQVTIMPVLLLTTVFFISGCESIVSTEDKPIPSDILKVTECNDPRRMACTKEYRPVCATKDTGVRCVKAPCANTTEKVTYSNSCMACADKKVYSYVVGACQ
jgi:DNA-directed RNA polymerase beta subunit